MTELKGFVSHIVYRNEENGYTVFEMTLTESVGNAPQEGPVSDLDAADIGDVITCVGSPVSISEGEGCTVAGTCTTHPVYGDQFRVQSYRAVAPENAQAMYRYLAAGSIKGIGPAIRWRTKKISATP